MKINETFSVNAMFAQGARCGHLEGKDRAGSYVIGEEHDLSWEAACANRETTEERERWAMGYRYGYRLAASGDALPESLRLAPLPDELAAAMWAVEIEEPEPATIRMAPYVMVLPSGLSL